MKLIKIENCKPGYILKGITNHKNRGHYMVFIKEYYFPDFIAVMISTKNVENKNILMSENHFEKKFDDNENCKVIFKNSHLVPAILHKYFEMGPFELCGILTEDGINFVSENIENLDIESWSAYLHRTNY
ncbi:MULTISPECIES: hypothetical protein [unclassified Flavobacterium]|jgi:hypothetical protein|uniref:hypothetical protein n=1 Tax=unclassified Flavobacterium TaxID=196869 RepID=UPI0025BFDE28|nr:MULTISPECIES: hypothetical protein [unclassified Flavobacterium]